MKAECEAASWWFTSQLQGGNNYLGNLSSEQILTFQKSLLEILLKKYEGHWYEAEPDRGNAFRSILFSNGKIDPVLITAASMANIKDLAKRFTTPFIMWVDPGSIKLQYSHSPKNFVVVYEQTNPREGCRASSSKWDLDLSSTPLQIVNKTRS